MITFKIVEITPSMEIEPVKYQGLSREEALNTIERVYVRGNNPMNRRYSKRLSMHTWGAAPLCTHKVEVRRES